MQKVKFHPAWDKTIAPGDRDRIERIFQETIVSTQEDIQFTTIQHAINHKRELLIIVLVHNNREDKISFDNQKLFYMKNNHIVAEHIFTPPSLTIEPQTSMPWTFIFPPESFQQEEKFEKGIITMDAQS